MTGDNDADEEEEDELRMLKPVVDSDMFLTPRAGNDDSIDLTVSGDITENASLTSPDLESSTPRRELSPPVLESTPKVHNAMLNSRNSQLNSQSSLTIPSDSSSALSTPKLASSSSVSMSTGSTMMTPSINNDAKGVTNAKVPTPKIVLTIREITDDNASGSEYEKLLRHFKLYPNSKSILDDLLTEEARLGTLILSKYSSLKRMIAKKEERLSVLEVQLEEEGENDPDCDHDEWEKVESELTHLRRKRKLAERLLNHWKIQL